MEKKMAQARRWNLALGMAFSAFGWVSVASAQGLSCNAAAAVVPNLRHEGFTELTADVVLSCVGAPGSKPTPAGSAIPQTTVSVSLSVPVTSRILSAGTPPLTEAVLLVDDPSPANQDPCRQPTNPAVCEVLGDGGQTFNNAAKFNVFEGAAGASGTYSLTFQGVPADPPATGARTYRITNVRVDATAAPVGTGLTPVYAFVSASGSMTISNPQNTVGYVSAGLNSSTMTVGDRFLECQTYASTKVGAVTFTENFASAFKTRITSAQNVPGVIYYTESGLEISLAAGETGTADTGTRLQTTISNIPPGVTIYADNWAQSSAAICTSSSCPVPSDVTLAPGTGTPSDPGKNP